MSLTFLDNNRVLDATLSMITGTENAQFPLTNLQKDFTTKVFRSNENVIEILVDLKISESIDAFAIVGSSATGIGFTDITIQGSGSIDFTGAAVINIDIAAEFNFGFKLFTAASFRFWKISVVQTAGSFVELSNFFIGTKTQLTQNGFSSASFVYTGRENVRIQQNRFGQRFIDKYNKINELSGSVEFVNSAEFTTINEVFMQHGRNIPLWVLVDPDGQLVDDGEFIFSGYFYFTEDIEWQSVTTGLFNIELAFSEAT